MKQTEIDFVIPTEFGGIGFIMSEQMIAEIRLMTPDECALDDPCNAMYDEARMDIKSRLAGYLNNPSTRLSLPTQDTAGTSFQRRVWQAIRTIPVGETVSYGQLANQLNSSPRAVANACGANPYPIVTPCHRVVSQHGLGGFMQGIRDDYLTIKRWLLRHEGVSV